MTLNKFLKIIWVIGAISLIILGTSYDVWIIENDTVIIDIVQIFPIPKELLPVISLAWLLFLYCILLQDDR